MKTPKLTNLLAISLVVMTSCVDSKYDISDAEINKDISIFNNGIALPVGNIDTLKIGDVLDLDNSEMIQIDEATQEYCLVKSGTSDANFDIKVNDANINTDPSSINRVAQAHNPFAGHDIDFSTPQENPETGEMMTSLELEINSVDGGDIEEEFNISSDDVPDEVLNFKEIKINKQTINVTIKLEDMGDLTDRIILDDQFYIKIPQSFITDDPNVRMIDGYKVLDLSGHEINVGSDNNGYMHYDMNVSGWNVGDEGIDIVNNSFTLTDRFTIAGSVHIKHLYATAPENIDIPISLTFDSFNSNITTATGKFNPQIDPINEPVEIDKNDLPDFLQDDNVCIDAAHASVEIAMAGDIPMNFMLDGTLSASKSSQIYNSAQIDNITVSNDSKRFLISDNGLQKEGFESVTVDNLNGLLKYIPDNIDMVMNAAADSENFYEIDINKDNNINIDYTFRAPLQFGEELNIIYDETIDGWHGDLEDINTSSVALRGIMVYRTPVDVELSAEAIDIDGNTIEEIEVEVVPTKIVQGDNELTVVMTDPTRKLIGASLDGIRLRLVMSNQSGNTETLRANDYIVFKDLSLKLPEGITIDGGSIF